MTKAQRQELKDKWLKAAKETGVYGAAVVGTFLGPYIEPWLANEEVQFLLSRSEVFRALGLGLAAMAVLKFFLDKGGKGHPEKLKAWKRRGWLSLAIGLMMNYIWPIFIKVITELFG